MQVFSWAKCISNRDVDEVLGLRGGKKIEEVGARINGYKLDRFRFKRIGKNWFTNRTVSE